MVGQINRGSKLGEQIYELSKLPEVKTIVEIGTWNGMGSTKCILDGVLAKKTRTYVYSLECNKLRHEEAKVNLGFLPPTFQLIHGSIVSYQELVPQLAILEDETLKGWLRDDLNWLRMTPNVMDKLPERIDLLIIDGGEFSGHLEFEKLWDRSTYIVLDDTNAIKHQATKKEILSKLETFEIIEDNTTDRNGYFICKVK